MSASAERVPWGQRLKSWLGFGGAEGSWRGPFYGTGELGGSYVLDPFEEGWQRNLAPQVDPWRVAVVYACGMMSARALAQCEPKHLVLDSDGGWSRSTTSPASRILRIPNEYETWPQIIVNTVAEMLFGGESLWLIVRDERYAPVAVHRVPRHSWSVRQDSNAQEYFYQVNSSGEMFSQPDWLVPSRDVCHFRQYCPRHPLVGESPISSAGLAIGLQVALNRSQLAFFSNIDRPSGTLQTDLELNAEQVKELRARFSEQSKKWNQGGTPILTHGMKFTPVGVAQNDAQLIEQQKMSALDIARVFGVPYALIGDNTGPQAGTEALITYWLSIGLGSLIESLERSLDRLFRLDAGNRVELDPTPLLRVDQASLVDSLGNAIQKGVMTPDEARARIRLSRVPGGDQAFLQRQMTAMNLLSDLNAAELENKLNPPAPPAPIELPAIEETEDEKRLDIELCHLLIKQKMLEAGTDGQ